MAKLDKYSETASLGRNRYQTTIGIKPINYQDGSTWKRISNNWGDSGVGERPHIVTTAPFMVSVAPDGDRRIHPTREDDVWFEMSGAKINQAGTWKVVQLGVPTSRVDNRITWNRTNYNAYMDMGGHFVKLGYLLKDGYLPPNNQFAYEVATNGLTRQGGTLLKDGVPVMHMRKPIAYDYDNPDDIRQIAHEIVRIDGKWHVVFTLPSLAGMSKPLIDPTLTLQPDAAAGEDVHITDAGVDNNYGVNVAIASGAGGTGSIYRSLIEFDVSSIPSDAIVDTATMSLYCTGENSPTNEDVGEHRGLVQWYEGEKDGAAPGATDGSTWNHRNANTGGQVAWAGGAGGASGTEFAATAVDTVTITRGSAEFSWDVKTDVANFVSGAQTNYGWWTICTDEANNNTLKVFAASDCATAAHRPKLVINYTEAGGAEAGNPRILQRMRLGY